MSKPSFSAPVRFHFPANEKCGSPRRGPKLQRESVTCEFQELLLPHSPHSPSSLLGSQETAGLAPLSFSRTQSQGSLGADRGRPPIVAEITHSQEKGRGKHKELKFSQHAFDSRLPHTAFEAPLHNLQGKAWEKDGDGGSRDACRKWQKRVLSGLFLKHCAARNHWKNT